LTTFLQLLTTFDNFFTTFLTTFWQLFWQLFDNFFDNFWHLLTPFDTFLTTFDNFWQLFLYFDGCSQLPQQILWNKFHIRCAYFTPNCTWSLNYSVLVYKSHLVVLSGNLKKCSFQSAIKSPIFPLESSTNFFYKPKYLKDNTETNVSVTFESPWIYIGFLVR
jgi:hypothetical protein